MFLEMQRIQLLEGDVWGHRKDITEYYSVPSIILEKITEMRNEGKSTEDIKKEISRKTKTNPEMIGYILTREFSA